MGVRGDTIFFANCPLPFTPIRVPLFSRQSGDLLNPFTTSVLSPITKRWHHHWLSTRRTFAADALGSSRQMHAGKASHADSMQPRQSCQVSLSRTQPPTVVRVDMAGDNTRPVTETDNQTHSGTYGRRHISTRPHNVT